MMPLATVCFTHYDENAKNSNRLVVPLSSLARGHATALNAVKSSRAVLRAFKMPCRKFLCLAMQFNSCRKCCSSFAGKLRVEEP